jgi:hypothetical protein
MPQANDKESMLKYAEALLHGNDSIKQNCKKAYKLYLDVAKKYQDSIACNTLGVMRKNGIGCEKNDTLAFRYFFAAARMSYPKAYYNLGLIYKEGEGVRQNFRKSFKNFYEAYKAGYMLACYALGYYYYKGIGVKQSYKNAVYYFVEGAKKGYASCMYCLSLCYRDGTGIEQNTRYADYWLQQSMRRGYKPAEKFFEKSLQDSISGKSTEQQKIKPKIKDKFKNQGNSFSVKKDLQAYMGNWEGTSYILDWSKTDILRSAKLQVNLFSSGDNRFYGEWIINDSIVSEVEGYFKDSVFIFEQADMLNSNIKLKGALFKLDEDKNSKTLLGEVALYSKKTKEPYCPNFILLQRKTDSAGSYRTA